MSLLDLSSREAVLQAMKEFDLVGRERFLEKYGYRPAHTYQVEHEGKKYDPKAVAGVAYGIQFPDRGPLKASEFSGGEDTTNPLLSRLGFSISRIAASGATAQQDPANEFKAGSTIRKCIEEFLIAFPVVRKTRPFGRHDEIWRILSTFCQSGLAKIDAVRGRPHLKMEWSVGKGNWASVPWIGVYDDFDDSRSVHPLYCVYLFPKDMSGVYLTIIADVNWYRKQYGRAEARRRLLEETAEQGKKVEFLTNHGFTIGSKVDLQTDSNLGEDYAHAIVAHKHYSKEQLPQPSDIEGDLEAALGAYDSLLPAPAKAVSGQGSYWIFQANPKVFNIDGALDSLTELTWTTGNKGRDIHPGDQVFLWRSGSDAGIVARAIVIEAAHNVPEREAERPFFIDKAKFDEVMPRVVVRVEERFRQPLQRRVIQSVPALQDLMILRFANSGVFRVSPMHGRLLLEMLGESQQPDSGRFKIWLYAPGEGAEYWDEYYEQGLIGIGWRSLGDLRQYKTLEDVTAALVKGKQLDHPPVNAALACFEFAHVMKPGDKVYVKRGRSTVIGFGVITGPYQHDPARSEQPNIRAVRWELRDEWKYSGNLPVKTLTEITDQPDTIAELERLVRQDGHEPIEQIPPAQREPYSIDDAVSGLFMSRDEFERILAIWRMKKNLILQGPPGVGKSFIAKRLGYALMGYRDQSRVRSVQFHQSYSYEDFVQGYRPSPNGLVLKDGLFYDFCLRARKDPAQDYVFIIDEINRGNLSKILGELMLLVEGDKRGPEWATKLAYAESEERFYVPPNVYLLGMMNTADRSLSLVDYALRRRFAFVRLAPLYDTPAFRSALDKFGAEPELIERIIARMTELNSAIAADAANLGLGFCIGHSFFTQAAEGEDLADEWYRRIVETEIGPLLDEYWFDNPDRAAEWRKKLLA